MELGTFLEFKVSSSKNQELDFYPLKSNQKLILDFTFFHLEMSNDCERDFVAIYRGAKLNKLVGKYCGRQAPPAIIFSADEALRIEFHTDGEAGNDDPTGFALKFYKVCPILNNGGIDSKFFSKEIFTGDWNFKISENFRNLRKNLGSKLVV